MDFSIEPASLAAVATNRYPGHFSTASSFNSSFRGSDAAAHEEFPMPRPPDGTLDFGIAPALPAAMTTRADSAGNCSTGASFNAAVRGSDMAARDCFARAKLGGVESATSRFVRRSPVHEQKQLGQSYQRSQVAWTAEGTSGESKEQNPRSGRLRAQRDYPWAGRRIKPVLIGTHR